MMIIPGWLIAIATFPGIIVHEGAHAFFCRLRGVAILEACFLRVGNPAGYVIHERPKDFTTSFLISVGPFLVNSIFCVLICFPAVMRVKVFNLGDPFSGLLLWLGISIGMHAFPSTQDASSLWGEATRAARQWNLLAMLSFPLMIAIYIANALRFFWFDYIYGAAIGYGLPLLLLKHL